MKYSSATVPGQVMLVPQAICFSLLGNPRSKNS